MSLEGGSPEFESRDERLEMGVSKTPEESMAEKEPLPAQIKGEEESAIIVDEILNEPVEEDNVEIGEAVKLIAQDFDGGLKSFKLEVDPQLIQECYINDKDWDEGFRKHIGPNYPYTMSPKTTQLIAKVGTDLKKKMFDSGFEIDPWKINPEEEPYVLGVLRRVMVPDTIEPIIGYTDHMAKHLKDIKEKDPSHVLSIRSFFCGAAVADKCLVTRLYELGLTANIVATDLAADSIAIGALNFTVWNELLPEQDRYEIHIVKGDIPKELVGKDKTIVLQVGDARVVSKRDTLFTSPKYDALLLDNGLQYMSPDFTKELMSNVTKNVGDKGLYVGSLGLDAGIKVEIPKKYHITQILKSFVTDLRKDYAKKSTSQAPYEYAHKYRFDNVGDGNVLITGVISDGAARMYTWLGHLLSTDRGRFKEVMDAIKSATELSKANKIVETTPFDYHQIMVDTTKANDLNVEELELPLNYKSFGWDKVGENRYSNGKETVDGTTMMRLCRDVDPLVLRRSRLFVNKTNVNM